MARPAVLFPDPVEITVSYFAAALAERDDTATVSSSVPVPRPSRFVTVQRHGGVRRDVVTDTPQLTIECWDDIEENANDLARVCRALASALAGRTVNGIAVYRVDELAGPGPLPDPDSHQARYTFGIVPHMRGVALD